MPLAQPRVYAVSGVPLLARRPLVGLQHPLDVFFEWPQAGLIAITLFARRRDRAVDRLPHHPAMDAVFASQAPNRLTGRVGAPEFFE